MVRRERDEALDAVMEAHRSWIEGRAALGCVALHWLLGLLLLARGARVDAIDAFDRELGLEHSGHLYARECAANTWYAIGVTRVAAGDRDGAREALLECLSRVPSHPMARAALGDGPPAESLSPVDAAMALAVRSAARNDSDGCEATAAWLERALAEAPHGNVGWLLPVEPMLAVSVRPEPWLAVLARLRRRAA